MPMPEPEIKIEEEVVEEKEVILEEVTNNLVSEEERLDIEGLPGKDHPRFKKVYAKLKAAERRVEALEKRGEEDTSLKEEMKEHNRTLQDALERTAIATEKASEATVKAAEQSAEDVLEKEFKGIHTRLLEQKKNAYEQQDYGTVVEIDDKLSDLKIEMNKLNNDKNAPKVSDETTNTALSPERQKEVERFMGNTSQWWEKDPMMTGAAKQIEQSLLTDVAWLNKPYGDLLDEVQKQIEKRFGFTGGKEDETPSVNTVEGSSNVSQKGGATVVKLSREELKIAKGLGVSPEEWAQQKALTAQGAK
jgi:hypothetical protein